MHDFPLQNPPCFDGGAFGFLYPRQTCITTDTRGLGQVVGMALPGGADTEKAMKMAQQEMDYRVDLYNRCFSIYQQDSALC